MSPWHSKSGSVLVLTPQASFSSAPIAHATHRILPDKSAPSLSSTFSVTWMHRSSASTSICP
jgi:hypothetical protein